MTPLSDFDYRAVITVIANLAANSNRFGNRPDKVLSKNRSDRRRGAGKNMYLAAMRLATRSLSA
jgi:hypothetical protein